MEDKCCTNLLITVTNEHETWHIASNSTLLTCFYFVSKGYEVVIKSRT